MRKKILVILYIALCMTMTLPVYAGKGGKKGKPNVIMTDGIDYDGTADVRDTRTKIVVRVYAKNPVNPMTFYGWHTLVDNLPRTQFEFEFYVFKTEGELGDVNFVFAWDNYVMKAKGYADGVSGNFDIYIEIGEIRTRGQGNDPGTHVAYINPVSFTVTY